MPRALHPSQGPSIGHVIAGPPLCGGGQADRASKWQMGMCVVQKQNKRRERRHSICRSVNVVVGCDGVCTGSTMSGLSPERRVPMRWPDDPTSVLSANPPQLCEGVLACDDHGDHPSSRSAVSPQS